jgi:predicted alpha/beta-fold hydrolase
MGELFRPLPLLGNAHVQTLLGNLFARGPAPPSRLRLVTLPDGDRLALHDSVPAGWRPGGPVVLLVHGLGGSHASGYMRRVALHLHARGVRVVRMDLRGAGRGAGLARKTYNGGCSPDVRAAAEEVLRWAPGSPLALAGFSLGGNIVLKLAGEAADQPLPGLWRVAAVAPPVDFERCSAMLARPRNRFYESYFIRGLLCQVRALRRHFPDLPLPRFPPRLTLRQFDDLYTAPRGGYAGADDYYRRASSLPLIPRIGVPSFILTARDDPFIAVESFEGLPHLPSVEVHIARRGGHLGFLGWDGRGGVRWSERVVVDWLCGR